MATTFTITLNQALTMLLFIAIGFFMRKKKLGGEGVPKVLAAVIVNVFSPALMFSSFESNFHLDSISENFPFFVAGVAVLAVTFPLAKLLASYFGETQLQKDVYTYSFLIPNLGYMGYPLFEAVFHEEILFKMLIFVIPYNLVIFTYGIYILNPKHKMDPKQILNPPMIAMLVGMIFGVLGIRLPAFLNTAVATAKDCMAPCAMLLTGYVLAAVPVGSVLRDGKLYLSALVRSVAIPCVILGLMYLLPIDPCITLVAVGTLSMPMGLNTIVFPEAYGGDGLTGAKTAFVSTLIGLLTVPLMFALLGVLTA